MLQNKEKNFLLQQGFLEAGLGCTPRYGALQFQPRVVGGVFLVGLITQSGWLFLALSVALWLGVIKPEKNLFEALYRKTLGKRPGAEAIPPAPAPRRFAQGMAGMFTLLIGLCLVLGRPVWAWLLEAMMAVALLLLVSAGFCLGSVVYWAVKGNWDFAKKTLPWA
jgi:hypothetical protein